MTRKVLILKGVNNYDSYSDIDFTATSSEYHELDDRTYEIVARYIGNLYDKLGQTYRMVEYAQAEEVQDVISRCMTYHDKYEAEKKRQELNREKRKKEDQAKALERKRKQLEKLKKELGAE